MLMSDWTSHMHEHLSPTCLQLVPDCTFCTKYSACVNVCLQIGESGWAPPLPLESSDGSTQPDDVNTKPVLLRAHIPEWGTVHEVVARVEMAGSGFERTMVGFLFPWPLCLFDMMPIYCLSWFVSSTISALYAEQCNRLQFMYHSPRSAWVTSCVTSECPFAGA